MGTAQGLAGKRAFVTAAGQGIGRAVSLELASRGAQVVAADINKETLAELEPEPGISTMCLDATNDAALAAAVTDCDPQVLVNVVGVVHHGSILDCSREEWDFAWQLNVSTMYVASKAALPGMLRGGQGRIINLSSVASSIKGAPARFAYGTTKAAVIGLTKSIAADFVKQGICVNAVCPGTVRSPSWEQRVRDMADRDSITEQEATKRFVSRQPMGRVGEATEVASLVAYLASDEAAFVTGQEFCIDGGWGLM